jgi:hypothetical protein
VDAQSTATLRAFLSACPAGTQCQKEDPTMSISTSTSRAETVAATQFVNRLLRRIALCTALTVFNAIVVAKFAGVLYVVTLEHPFERAGVTLIFAALLASLARTWFLALSNRPR